MQWNWQKKGWGNFTYDEAILKSATGDFLNGLGECVGILKHSTDDTKNIFKVELMRDEALTTSFIEGEILDRDSVQSSICNQFGIKSNNHNVPDREFGISSIMFDLYENYVTCLTEEKLCEWHNLLFTGNLRIKGGQYRNTDAPMQIVSGAHGKAKIHFEAPPPNMIVTEMQNFLAWFNRTPDISPIIKAGIAHLYFECIHPFEDGNGRIGRAIIEKAISQNIGQPSLLMISYTINQNKKAYYKALEQANKSNEITEWLIYFTDLIKQAQKNTIQRIDFIIKKTKLYDTVKNTLNPRQQKVLARILEEGIDGFKGGLSAENYQSITKASSATATRDLKDMVEKGVLIKNGELRYTRYYLNI